MALPDDVSTCRLTFGRYLRTDGSTAFAGLTGYITPSVQIRHLATGDVVVDEPIAFTLDADGSASVVVPHTDQPGLDRTGFTYTVRWNTPVAAAREWQQTAAYAPQAKTIALPVASGPEADYDALQTSPVDPGVAVPIAVGPRGFSAYELAVIDGFAGTEDEWLASLVGPPTPPTVIEGLNARIDLLRDSTATDAELAQARFQLLALLDGKVSSDDLGTPGYPPALSANGKLPTSVLPVNSTTERVSVPSRAARLALTASQVQPGDLAVQADDGTVWLLVAPDPALADSWVEQLLRSDLVTSIQGQVGDVSLTPSDIGADPAGTAQALAAGLTAQVGGQLAQAVGAAAAAATSAATSEGYAAQAAGAATAAQGSASSAAASARAALTTAEVRGDNLVFTSQDGATEVTAGNVRGPKGDQGIQGTQGIQGIQGLTGDLSPATQSTASSPLALPSSLPLTRTYTLAANLTISMPGTAPSAQVAGTNTFIFKQAATGGPFTLTWPALTTLRWAGGAPAPIMPTSPGARLVVHLFWTGTEWLGLVGGVFS